MKPPFRILLMISAVFIFLSCRKQSFTYSADALLQTNVDTLHFNTLFTGTGSIVQSVKIINTNNKSIHIESIQLAGGNASPFKINIDGLKGNAYNVDLGANDSLYIFVTVAIPPNGRTMPFIIQDSISYLYNGNTRFIQLDALGQNAHFFSNKIITANETWNNDLPYVISGSLTISDADTLTINKGCRIYLHANAPFIVNGSLQVFGEKFDSTRVIFSGDRLDDPYSDYPASYPGLIFTPNSRNNQLTYTIIKNAYQGIAINGTNNNTPSLILNQVIIDNAFYAGILAASANIQATNLLVSNCGKNLFISGGGTYAFTHCTVASYGNNFIEHKDPVLFITNGTQANQTPNALNALFRNCIFWGDNNGFVTNEVVISKNDNAPLNVNFDHVLWREPSAPTFANATASINASPLFDSINTTQRYYSFRQKSNSPAINAGIAAGVTIDLDGQPRPPVNPDIGCYQKQ